MTCTCGHAMLTQERVVMMPRCSRSTLPVRCLESVCVVCYRRVTIPLVDEQEASCR